jgi:hypothetical protein
MRWTSIDGLRHYHDGLDAFGDGNHAGALDGYRKAATTEVSNLALQLGLTRAYNHLADEQRTTDPKEARQNYIKALLAALRATKLDGYSVEAHCQLGLVAFKVGDWRTAWWDSPERNEICTLLGKEPEELYNAADVRLFFLRLSDKAWRKAQRRTWWPVTAFRALWLDRRRTLAGQVRPFSRRRKSLHDVVLAAVVGTGYDVLDTVPPSAPSAVWYDRARCLIGLWTVRFGRLRGLRRALDQEGTLQYNLAAAYARRAVYLRDPEYDWSDSAPEAAKKDSGRRRLAVRCLNRAFFGPEQQLRTNDLEDVAGDRDFVEVRRSKAYKAWRGRFRTKARDVWRERFTSLASNSDAADRWWADHLIQATPRTFLWSNEGATWAQDVIVWFGDEVERWAALSDWIKDPTSSGARSAFEKAVGSPPTNEGRPITPPPEVHFLPNTNHRAVWDQAGTYVELALSAARAALERAVRRAEDHELQLLRTDLQQLAIERRQWWELLTAWAVAPTP